MMTQSEIVSTVVKHKFLMIIKCACLFVVYWEAAVAAAAKKAGTIRRQGDKK